MRGSRMPSFRHGIHPAENKYYTNALSIERMPFVDEYVLPLAQHIGAPAIAEVKAGEYVHRGTQIARAGGFVSTVLHAPVSGEVIGIEQRLHPNGKLQPAIVLRTDPYADQRVNRVNAVDPATLDAKAMVSHVQASGLVGLGGAAFPSHVKFSVPEGKRVQFVIVNGCECEPYLTCDHRIMVERPEAVLRGTDLIMAHTGAKTGYIGIEANKPDAITLLKSLAPANIKIIPVQVKYPQGAEKMLIDAVLKQEVPAGGLPLDIEVLVNNVGTTAALADWFDQGIPLVERVVTVTGDGIKRPRNLMVPLGTPIEALIDYCGGLTQGTRYVIAGGPMMGMSQKSLQVPVLKGTSGVLCLKSLPQEELKEYPCIKCGRCLEACPMFLNPTRLASLARKGRIEDLLDYHVLDCFECASCSFSCPSNIPLVQWIRVGKGLFRELQQKNAA